MSINQVTYGRTRGTFANIANYFLPTRPTRTSVALTLILSAAIGVILGIVYLGFVKPTYTVSMTIGPTQEQFASTPSSQLDRNAMSLLSGGGLLSGPRVITPYDAFLKTIQTREVAARLYNDPEIRDQFFPGAWDNEKKEWKDQTTIKTELVGVLYWLTGRQHTTTPTIDGVAQVLQNRLGLSMIDRGPMYMMTFPATGRAFGISLLARVFAIADGIVKEQNREQVQHRLAALRARMNDLDVVDYRSQFANLIMDQEKQLIVLQGNTDFAASILVPPSAPDYPDNPRLFTTLVIFLVLSLLFGASILVIAYRKLISERIRPTADR